MLKKFVLISIELDTRGCAIGCWVTLNLLKVLNLKTKKIEFEIRTIKPYVLSCGVRAPLTCNH